MRYEAVFGFNSKQWWLYDNETDEYCDPPISVLKEIEKIEDIDEQGFRLEEIANEPNDWIDDKEYRYNGEDWDI